MSLRCSRPRPSSWDVSKVDRISELPDPVIGYILSFLPTKEAVATSSLSKSWRARWKEAVTTFDMEASWWHYRKSSQMEFSDRLFPNFNFESVAKFRLRWRDVNSHSYFIHTAISAIPRTVGVLKVLDLVNSDHSHTAELPPDVFTCKYLEVLRLDGKFTIKRLDAACLPKLAELELINQSDKTISELISSCPVLQSLTVKLRPSTEDRILTVSSLTLKRLHISCSPGTRRIKKLKIDAPTLEYLELHDSESKDISIHGLRSVNEVVCHSIQPDLIVGLMESSHGVKFLKLSEYSEWALDRATKKLSASFERLTKLVVKYDDNSRWNWLLDLMDQCVNLRVLEIHYWGCDGSASQQSHVVIPRCLSSSLRTLEVTFKLCREYEGSLKMMEFILSHSLVLERVNLWFDFGYIIRGADRKRNKILRKVLMMPKASPNCKFVPRNIRHLGALERSITGFSIGQY